MSSNYINVVIILLETLLVSCFMLAGHSNAQCDSKTHDGTLIENVELERNPKLSSPEQCRRECRENEPRRTCYYHFTIELYPVLGSACQAGNSTNPSKTNCQCVTADGIERMIASVNRMLPGPSIEVCKGDRVIIDVFNKMEGMEVTIHWHGIFQNGSQYYDGVPMVTQCSILQGNTFRYQWVAGNAGTHFWHSHSGLQKMDGVHGSLIVREAKSKEPNAKLYEMDLPEHVVVLSDWMQQGTIERYPGLLETNTGQTPDSVLINGKGRFTDRNNGSTTNTPLKIFDVEANRTYRFRLINAFSSSCSAQFHIQGHSLIVIATDGVPVHPVTVDIINSYSGERYDFVIEANQPSGTYWIRLRCCQAHQIAILRYANGPREPSSKPPTYNDTFPQGVVLNPPDGICDSPRDDAICVSQLRSAETVDSGISQPEPDVKIFLPIDFAILSPERLFRPNTYQSFLVTGNGLSLQSTVGGFSFKFPSAPLLSQTDDISPEEFCDFGNKSANCGDVCSCTHQYHIPLHSIVQICFYDASPNGGISHPFHLHGYAFNVIGMGRFPDANTTNATVDHVRDLERKGLLKRNWDKPPFKDTIAVPGKGWVLIRFRASNPGPWLCHCHILFHLLSGMGVILNVGDREDLPPVPPGFPTCGNYLPRIKPAATGKPDKVSSCNKRNRNQDWHKRKWTRG